MSTLNDISSKFTVEVLDKIIQDAGGLKHTSWEFGSGFTKGDSMLSEVFRFFVHGENQNGDKMTVRLVIKALPRNIARNKTFRSTDFFENEINFYKTIVPIFNEFQNKRKPQNPYTGFPVYYSGYWDKENDYVALEDLSPGGYRTAPRQEGLDITHCRKIMQTLGRFHALSFALRDQEPEKFKQASKVLKETYYADAFRGWYDGFLKGMLMVGSDAVTKEYGGTVAEEKMKSFVGDADKFYKMLSNLCVQTNEYSVLGHGDCWMPNFLFTYKDIGGESVPVDVKVIDYQLARLASPALDISFFIYSCTLQDLREKHYDELLQLYHDSLSEYLREVGTDPEKVFPFSALQSELKTAARFGAGMSLESLPFSILENSEAFDLDTLTGTEAVPLASIWKIQPIPTQKGRLRIADCIRHAVERGYLD